MIGEEGLAVQAIEPNRLLLLLSGVLCVLAFALFATGNGLAGVISIMSAVLTIPFAMAALVYARQIRRQRDENSH